MTRWKPIPTAAEGDDLRWVGHGASDRFPVYTRGNAGEVYPEVFTPLSFSVAADAGERSMRAAILASGLILPHELDEVPLTTAVGSGVFGGYAYLNLSIQRTAAARMPGGSAADADVNYLGVGDPPPHRPIAGERNLRASVAGLASVVRLLRRAELPELADDQRAVERYLASLPPVDGTDDQLASLNDDFIPLFEHLFTRHLLVTSEAGLLVSVLAALCEHDRNRAVQLLAGLGGVDSGAPLPSTSPVVASTSCDVSARRWRSSRWPRCPGRYDRSSVGCCGWPSCCRRAGNGPRPPSCGRSTGRGYARWSSIAAWWPEVGEDGATSGSWSRRRSTTTGPTRRPSPTASPSAGRSSDASPNGTRRSSSIASSLPSTTGSCVARRGNRSARAR